jgi:hypothetical protein
MTEDEQLWRRRFLIYMGARLVGLAIFFLGIAIAYTGLLRPRGWPQLGAILAIFGAVDSVFAPRLIKKRWEREGK